MPDLDARSDTGLSPGWSMTLTAGTVVLTGKPPAREQLTAAGFPPDAIHWPVPWDKCVSTPHACLDWDGSELTVRRRLTPKPTTNPVVYRGEAVDACVVQVGEHFSIGDTTFTVSAGEPGWPAELTLSHGDLRRIAFSDPARQIEILADLPDLIRMAGSERDLQQRLVEVLLAGIPTASVAAIVQPVLGAGTPAWAVSAVHHRHPAAQADFVPSRRLVQTAVDRQQSVLHAWAGLASGADEPTRAAAHDWALCVPSRDDRHRGWAVYVAGRLGPSPNHTAPTIPAALKADLRFAELAADLFASLRSVTLLQKQNALLGRFLSPIVLEAIGSRDVEALLEPREMTVTVLVCDLRGSSRLAEDGVADLMGTWGAVSEALSVMSNAILEYDGVISDFQGDAALGFWGWPLPDENQVEQACRAALNIRKRFAQAGHLPGHRLARVRCGIGIAHGRAIAGRIGVPDQFKVGVFGPTVNLAARCEGLTKHFGVSIVLDESSARAVAGGGRVRRLATVRPAGIATAVGVAELLPPVSQPDALTEGQRQDYEAALAAFQLGKWDESLARLKYLKPVNDGPTLFLAQYIADHPHGPTAGWDGVIEFGQR